MSFKSIAVPVRIPAKRRGAASAPADMPVRYVPATGARQTARGAHVGQSHRFVIGQRLTMRAGGSDISRAAAICHVVATLPREAGPFRYRVRSENESFERIVDESDLTVPPADPVE